MSFKQENLATKIYVVLVAMAASAFLAFNIPDSAIPGWPWAFLFFVALNIVVENLEVPLPREPSTVSVGFAVDMALIVLMGPAAVAWANVSSLINVRKAFYRKVFNASQLSLSAGVAGYAYLYAGGVPGQIRLPGDLFPILVSVVTYFILNTTLMTGVLSLSQRLSMFGIWLTNFRWAVPNCLAVAPLGVLIAAVFDNMGITGVLLLIIPLMLARHTFIMYMDMRKQYLSTIKALTKAIDAKDHYTHGHSERVARYVVMIAREMGLQDDYVEKLEYLALMHDIGKIGIPETILNKPTRLSDEEFDIIRGHAAVGADIISNIRFIGDYADIVRHHHERVDGRGYPDGLTGDQMSVGARIVGVADAFDAMTSQRVYRAPMSMQEAAAELERCTDAQFCRVAVSAFLKALRRKGEIKL
jgi:putative nucleotidyltransferase with HDIG domain